MNAEVVLLVLGLLVLVSLFIFSMILNYKECKDLDEKAEREYRARHGLKYPKK